MTANKLIRNSLWATLLAALVAVMVSLFVFVEGGAAAPASDKPTYEPYIINGEPVPNDKYPFMAALIDENIKGTIKDKLFCGGSLIDKTHVLTAGHCVFLRGPGTPPPTKPQDTQVIVGRTVLSSNQGQVRNVKDIDVHPFFKALKLAGTFDYRYDAAVLTLSSPVKGIKPIELATSSQNNLERPGRHATIAGWGDTVPNDNPKITKANRMQEAQVPIVSDSRADKAWEKNQGTSQPTDFVPRLMIGAGGKQTITCQGDSGGPLFVRTSGNGDGDNGDDENSRDTNGGSGGKYTQIGITSFGPVGCLTFSRIAVYTEVNAEPIASFIESTADNGDGDNGDDNGDDK
jgi:secreted trypsin-like serine protease